MQKRRPTNIKCCGKNAGKFREDCNHIENVVVYLKSVSVSENFRLVVEEYVEELLVVEEDDTGIVVYLKAVSEIEKNTSVVEVITEEMLVVEEGVQ